MIIYLKPFIFLLHFGFLVVFLWIIRSAILRSSLFRRRFPPWRRQGFSNRHMELRSRFRFADFHWRFQCSFFLGFLPILRFCSVVFRILFVVVWIRRGSRFLKTKTFVKILNYYFFISLKPLVGVFLHVWAFFRSPLSILLSVFWTNT